MFWTIMIIAIVALAIAWGAYGLWEMKMRAEEKKRPRQVSKRLQKTKSEVADWAEKMAKFQPPKRKKPASPDQQNKPDGAV
jgi:FtsZ-interacting cell division protein ZipA